MSLQLADAEHEAEAARVLAECPWKEHRAPDGRSYFHNKGTKQSVWKEPPELTAAKQRAAELRAKMSKPAAAPPAAAPRSTTPGTPAQAAAAAAPAGGGGSGEFMYRTKEEAIAAFKAFLTDAKPPREGKWDAISKSLEARRDPRFNALKKDGERHSAFKKWVVEQKEQDVRTAAAAADQRRRQFVELLNSKAGVLAGARFGKAEAVCFEDPRWEALPASERPAVFEDWAERQRKEAKEAERAALDAKVWPRLLISAITSWVHSNSALACGLAFVAGLNAQCACGLVRCRQRRLVRSLHACSIGRSVRGALPTFRFGV